MTWTLRPAPLSPADRAFLQRIINLYHRRLLAAWNCVTEGAEAVPDSHVAPPSIADWPNRQIRKALNNFSNHLKWYDVAEDAKINNPTENSSLNKTQWILIYQALRLLKSDTAITQDLRTQVFRKCEPNLLKWESCVYPTLRTRWEKLGIKGQTARNKYIPKQDNSWAI
ncbi:hypothetical protein EDC01DRAFT_665519 [Geopyxis carbonaria]|nr:hypothetical protein EDC01DRAFT_665519 [Geopyxis carbonaria]